LIEVVPLNWVQLKGEKHKPYTIKRETNGLLGYWISTCCNHKTFLLRFEGKGTHFLFDHLLALESKDEQMT